MTFGKYRASLTEQGGIVFHNPRAIRRQASGPTLIFYAATRISVHLPSVLLQHTSCPHIYLSPYLPE